MRFGLSLHAPTLALVAGLQPHHTTSIKENEEEHHPSSSCTTIASTITIDHHRSSSIIMHHSIISCTIIITVNNISFRNFSFVYCTHHRERVASNRLVPHSKQCHYLKLTAYTLTRLLAYSLTRLHEHPKVDGRGAKPGVGGGVCLLAGAVASLRAVAEVAAHVLRAVPRAGGGQSLHTHNRKKMSFYNDI